MGLVALDTRLVHGLGEQAWQECEYQEMGFDCTLHPYLQLIEFLTSLQAGEKALVFTSKKIKWAGQGGTCGSLI